MIQRTIRAVIAVCLTTAGAMAVTSGAAYADATVTSQGGTIYTGCTQVPFDYTVGYPGADHWEMYVELYDGYDDSADYTIVSGTGETATGTDSLKVCDTNAVGVFTMETSVTYYTATWGSLHEEHVTSRFTMVKQRSRTNLKVSDRTPRYDSVVRLVATSRIRTPDGPLANGREYVVLEARCGQADWARVRESKKRTDRLTGKAVWRYRWNIRATCVLRAKTLPNGWTVSSTSANKRINPVGRATDS